MNQRWFYTLLVVFTFFTIFEDDVKRAALPPSWDLTLEIVITLLVVFFVVEISEWVPARRASHTGST